MTFMYLLSAFNEEEDTELARWPVAVFHTPEAAQAYAQEIENQEAKDDERERVVLGWSDPDPGFEQQAQAATSYEWYIVNRVPLDPEE